MIFIEGLKRPKVFLRLAGMILIPVITLLVRLESLISNMTDYMARQGVRITNHLPARKRIAFYRMLARDLMPFRLTDRMLSQMHTYNIPLKTSFASSVYLRTEYSSGILLPEWKINSKLSGKRFARAMGLRVPEDFQENVSCEEVQLRAGSVIKPVNACSATGIFIVKSEQEILEMKTHRLFHSQGEVKTRMIQLLQSKSVVSDAWIVEEFIGGPDGEIPDDVKFFAFYGKVDEIAEMKRYPAILCDMYNANNQAFDSGLYPSHQIYRCLVACKEEIELAERISLEIPTPLLPLWPEPLKAPFTRFILIRKSFSWITIPPIIHLRSWIFMVKSIPVKCRF